MLNSFHAHKYLWAAHTNICRFHSLLCLLFFRIGIVLVMLELTKEQERAQVINEQTSCNDFGLILHSQTTFLLKCLHTHSSTYASKLDCDFACTYSLFNIQIKIYDEHRLIWWHFFGFQSLIWAEPGTRFLKRQHFQQSWLIRYSHFELANIQRRELNLAP